jgi:hypothetical protein
MSDPVQPTTDTTLIANCQCHAKLKTVIIAIMNAGGFTAVTDGQPQLTGLSAAVHKTAAGWAPSALTGWASWRHSSKHSRMKHCQCITVWAKGKLGGM